MEAPSEDTSFGKMILICHIFKSLSLVHPFRSPESTFMEWIQNSRFLLKEINMLLAFDCKRVLTIMDYWHKGRNSFLTIL